MDRDEIIRLLKKEIELEKGCLESAERFYKTTWNPFRKIYYKLITDKYIHSYATLICILDKIEKGH